MPRASVKKAQAAVSRRVPRTIQYKPQTLVTGAGLDEASRRYLALLNDPCASDMVPPTYGGTGSGYLMRTKQVLVPLNTTTDAIFEFTPGWYANGALRLSTAAGVGTPLSAVAATPVPGPLVTIAEQYRCVAACVKLYYTGSELQRKGMVFGTLIDAPSLQALEVPVATAAGYAMNAARFVRLGTEMHEYRWCPAEADQAFVSASTSTPKTADPMGSTLQVGFYGVEAGTVSFEVTAVWEWQPITGGTTGGSIVSTPRAPVTPLPLNAVLHKLGNLGQWATKPGNMQKTLQFAQGAYNAYTRVRPALALAM